MGKEIEKINENKKMEWKKIATKKITNDVDMRSDSTELNKMI